MDRLLCRCSLLGSIRSNAHMSAEEHSKHCATVGSCHIPEPPRSLAIASGEEGKMVSRTRYSLARPVVIAGIGIHTGQSSSIRLLPSSRLGLYVKRGGTTDASETGTLVSPSNYVLGKRTSLIMVDGLVLSCPEHVLGGLTLAGIDAAIIEVTGSCEIPCATGSEAGLLKALIDGGRKAINRRDALASIAVPTTRLIQEHRQYEVSSSDTTSFEVKMEFDGLDPATVRFVATEHAQSTVTAAAVAGARTWVFEEDLAHHQAAGLCLGIPSPNCQVIKRNALRDPGVRAECARHKLLDLLGDLYTLTLQLDINIRAVNPNHRMNTTLLHTLWSTIGGGHLYDN